VVRGDGKLRRGIEGEARGPKTGATPVIRQSPSLSTSWLEVEVDGVLRRGGLDKNSELEASIDAPVE
jgi:hypothetical protein